MKKSAFTIMELIFVIIVIGILAAVFMPKFGQNKLAQAANQVITHIRYTQHLALMDDKYDASNNQWYKSRWQIVFSISDNHADNKPAYSIFSDKDVDGTVDKSELAINPQDRKKFMSGGIISESTLDITNLSNFVGTKELNLGKEYGVTNIVISSTCSTGTKIGFDHLGRPMKGPFTSYDSSYPNGKKISLPCKISLFSGTEKLTIQIEPETGYAHLL